MKNPHHFSSPKSFFLLAAFLAVCLGASPSGAAGPTPLNACQPGTPLTMGSYVLTSNLVASLGENCFVIGDNGVTVDLAGFVIQGTRSTDFTTGSGFTDGGEAHRNVVIRNGAIVGFPDAGIELGATENVKVEEVRAIGSHHFGGILVGERSIVKDCIASLNVGVDVPGIQVGQSSVVTGNTANGNGIGIVVGVQDLGGSIVSGNTANENSQTGILAFASSTLVHNIANHNGDVGMSVECPSNVNENTAQFNGAVNFQPFVVTGPGHPTGECKKYENLF